MIKNRKAFQALKERRDRELDKLEKKIEETKRVLMEAHIANLSAELA